MVIWDLITYDNINTLACIACQAALEVPALVCSAYLGGEVVGRYPLAELAGHVGITVRFSTIYS